MLEPWFDTIDKTASRWWRRHPWRASAEMAGDAARRSMLPWLTRRPWFTVALGATLGAAVVAAAPWRWPRLRHAARRGGARTRRWLGRQLVHQLSTPAVQTLLAGAVASLLATQQQQAARRDAQDGRDETAHDDGVGEDTKRNATTRNATEPQAVEPQATERDKIRRTAAVGTFSDDTARHHTTEQPDDARV